MMKKKIKEKEKWPSVSFIVCTYNCKDNVRRCFNSIKNQNYPEKMELIAVDGYSTDGTIEVLKDMGIKTLFTKEYPEGKRGAKWLGYNNAKGEIVIFIDSDNKLMEKNWTREMVKPLINNDADFSICRMAVVKEDKLINRYLNLIGTDPFVAYKSIDSLLALRKLKLEDGGDYYLYNITPKNFIITGGYYFTAKKETLDRIGGYTQDTDVVYNLARNGLGNVAIPKDAHLHHLISDSIINFTKKKIWWADRFFRKQIRDRDFNWLPIKGKDKMKLSFRILNNFLFFPATFTGINMAIKDREMAWLLHPIMTWLTTYAYLYAFLKSKFSLNKI